jgi:hypothetical protein
MAGITLAQLAQVSKDPLTKFVALKILRDSPVMKVLPFENISSLTVQAQWWEQLPTGGAFRSLNEGYSSYEDGQLGEGQEALFGFGGDITFDRVLEQITNVVKDPIQVQQEGKLKAMTLNWNDYFINGDPATDPKGFSGLKKRVAGLPTRQTVYFAASGSAGLDVTTSAANAMHFFNDLEEMWHKCNGGNVSMIVTNESVILGFGRAMRYAQTAGNFLDLTQDTLGRDFYTWRGKPLLDMGTKKDMSTEIITLTETGGTGSSNTTSMYMVSCNMDDGLYGIQLNPLAVYDPLAGGEMESKPSKLRRVDWWNGLANFGRYCIVRGRNLLDPASWTA